jgi:hypothetical protein
MLAVLYIVACAGGDAPDGASNSDLGLIPTDVTPIWTPDDLSEAVLAMTELPPLNPQAVRDTYFELMSHGDAVCPGSTTQLIGSDLRGCTADSGWFYAGVSTWMEQEAAGNAPGGWLLSGDFEILDPEGHRFIGGGGVDARKGPEGADEARYSGQWSFPGGATDWLGYGISAYFQQSVVAASGAVAITGGLTYGEVSIWSDRLKYAPEVCDGLTGSVEIRDPSGVWFVLDYGDDCDTAGALSFDGESVGALDLDLTPWMRGLHDAAAVE